VSAFQTTRISWRGSGIRVDLHQSHWSPQCDHMKLYVDREIAAQTATRGILWHFCVRLGKVAIAILES